MSETATWLLIPGRGSLPPFETASLMVPYTFDLMMDHVERLPEIDPASEETRDLPGARRVTAAQWERDVVPVGRWFPESVDWPPGRVVELPPDVRPGEATPARRALSAFWVRWTFGEAATEGAPFNAARAASVLLALARTPDELARAVRSHCDFSTRFLRVALTRPDANAAADEKWAAAALRERWPDGLPEAALLELMASSDRALREYAIQELPRQAGRSR
jgi:hypothetical protein